MLGAYDSSTCDSDTGSASNGMLQPVQKRHSIHGNYKRPKRPRSCLCLQVYRRSVSRGEGPSNTAKDKFEAPPDMAEPTMQDAEDDQEQINPDYRNTVELAR